MADNTPAPKGSPRQVFGEALRFYRERSGLGRDELATLVHLSVSTIRAYEDGRRVPQRQSVAEIEDIAAMNADGALLMLWDQFEEGMRYQVFPDWLQDWAEAVEPRASALRWFEALLVPGLLQTEDYMRAIFSTRFGATQEEIDADIAGRLRRQEILSRERPPALWVILDEMVLRRPVGGRPVMAAQLGQLVEAARQPSVRIEVIRASVGAHLGLDGGSFAIADFQDAPSIGYLDTVMRGLPLKDAEDVAVIERTWDTLRSEAESRSASLALLEEVTKIWTSPT